MWWLIEIKFHSTEKDYSIHWCVNNNYVDDFIQKYIHTIYCCQTVSNATIFSSQHRNEFLLFSIKLLICLKNWASFIEFRKHFTMYVLLNVLELTSDASHQNQGFSGGVEGTNIKLKLKWRCSRVLRRTHNDERWPIRD